MKANVLTTFVLLIRSNATSKKVDGFPIYTLIHYSSHVQFLETYFLTNSKFYSLIIKRQKKLDTKIKFTGYILLNALNEGLKSLALNEEQKSK